MHLGKDDLNLRSLRYRRGNLRVPRLIQRPLCENHLASSSEISDTVISVTSSRLANVLAFSILRRYSIIR